MKSQIVAVFDLIQYFKRHTGLSTVYIPNKAFTSTQHILQSSSATLHPYTAHFTPLLSTPIGSAHYTHQFSMFCTGCRVLRGAFLSPCPCPLLVLSFFFGLFFLFVLSFARLGTVLLAWFLESFAVFPMGYDALACITDKRSSRDAL